MERKDAWSPDDDRILAETVLHYMSSGNTQIKAFEAASGLLKRTEPACAFRWNSEVRKHYEDKIRELKQRKRQRTTPETAINTPSPTQVDMVKDSFRLIMDELKKIKEENEGLKKEVSMLQRKLEHKERNEPVIAAIVDQVKKLGLYDKEAHLAN